MADENLIEQIFAGATREERPEDVLYLCTGMALAMFQKARERDAQLAPSPPERNAGTFLEGLRLAGEILCPIFQYVKPEDYVAEMTRTRLEYQGIAAELELQAEYVCRVRTLLDKDQLQSLAQAVANKVWQELRRG